MKAYTVQIPNQHWFECNLYLEQNYIKHRQDYSYSSTAGYINIAFYSQAHFDMFVARWVNTITFTS